MWADFVEHSRPDVQALQMEIGALAEQPVRNVDKMGDTAPSSQRGRVGCRRNSGRRFGNRHGIANILPSCRRGTTLLTEAFGGMSARTLTGLIAVNLTDSDSTRTICR